MSSKPEPKDVHQLNGTGPATSASSSDGPGREPLAGTSEFLGPDGTGVEVVVIESRANAKGIREEDALLENGSQSNESDDVSNDRGPPPPSPLKETSFSIGLQVLFPFLLAGFGTVAAGMVLDIVQVGGDGGKVAQGFLLLEHQHLELSPLPVRSSCCFLEYCLFLDLALSFFSVCFLQNPGGSTISLEVAQGNVA